MDERASNGGARGGGVDDGIDTRDTDRIDYPVEFVRKTRLELRRIGTALGAAENDLSGNLSPHQRRAIFFGLSQAFRTLAEFSNDAESMMVTFTEAATFEITRKPSVPEKESFK